MKWINGFIQWNVKSNLKRIFRYFEKPMEVQSDLWKKMIIKNRDTVWGKKYDYRSLKTIQQFQERVPISHYDDLKPYIQRMMKGESDVLWSGKIAWYSKSSGTTSDKSKFIPVSDENLKQCHIMGGRDTMAMWFYHNPDSKLFVRSKGLIMGGSWQRYAEYSNTKIGDISAVMIQNMPFYAKYFHTPSIQIALMDEWEEKIELMAHSAAKANVTNMSGVPTWTIVLLKRILELTGKDHLMELFPNFELYMHGGVSFRPYREQFKQLFPSDKVQYREVYNASEGFLGSQWEPNDDSMLLLLDNGVFYEFIPLSELHKPHPKAYTIDEVDTITNYALVITTNTGLWRYVIGDTVKFSSLYPHRIQITGRTKHFINVFGEEVMVENTDKALVEACRQTGAIVSEYTAAPIFMTNDDKGGHEWVVEFEKMPHNATDFANLLDKELQKVNSDYEAKRYKDMALQSLVLHPVPKGTFYKWLKTRGKYGGQNKVPRLSNKRIYVEALLSQSSETTV